MTRVLTGLRAVAAVALAQLRYEGVRTVLAVVAVALAVLSTTLLAGIGYGVLATGEEQFDAAGRDLWVTAGPLSLSPDAPGGVSNTLLDAHTVANEIESREGVDLAVPMAFQAVYVGTNASTVEPVLGVGVPDAGDTSRGGAIDLDAGPGFSTGDVHYGNGSYDGPMSQEILVDPRLAARFDLSVGETLHVGGTRASAAENRFTVVGVTSTFSSFLGVPSATLHLGELQTMTGMAGSDRATWITVTLTGDGDPDAVRADLARDYPEYEVRTNREQMASVLEDQAAVVAAAGTLVVLAVLSGLALTVNLLALVVYQQRIELATLRASGLSATTLVGVVASQGIAIGLLGALLGVLATPPAAAGLDLLAERVVGLSGLVRTPPEAFALGAIIAVVIGTASAAVAGWQVGRLGPLTHLRE